MTDELRRMDGTSGGSASNALWHADCLDVAPKYVNGSFQMLLTSTPYVGQRGFDLTGPEYLKWWRDRLEAWVPKLDPDSGVVVQNIGPMSRVRGWFCLDVFDVPKVMEDAGLGLVDVYVWDKMNAPPSGNQARTDRGEWEFVFVGARSASYTFHPVRGPYSPKTVGKARTGMRQPDLAGSMAGGHERLHDEGARLGNVVRLSSSGDQGRPRVAGGSFPRGLVRRFMAQHTNEGDAVVDPCVGSGTTLVVAAEMGRVGVGIDLDPDAISVASEWTGLVPRSDRGTG